ncbi:MULTISPECIES: hypothetical protein [unclassified Xanthobacter]|uniref:hypothetical protein n=1 Tax=unclassified Xanthobacter TaxID=2623496 RepID=UPI001EDED389|nr:MULTISPECIES: hypothetical protein [unclassified Xanthobacter]
MAQGGQDKPRSVLVILGRRLVLGMVFLLPAVLVLIVLGHAIKLVGALAKPVSHLVPVEDYVGVSGESLIGLLLILLIAFGAGYAASTRHGRRVTRFWENSLLGGVPQYQLVKSMADGLTQVESMAGVTPALISRDGAWQLGYQLEEIPDGWAAVFIPRAPTPMSGDLFYVPKDRVVPLNIPMAQAMMVVKRMGLGSGDALRKAGLVFPEG